VLFSERYNRKHGVLAVNAGRRENSVDMNVMETTECSVIQDNSAVAESKKFPFNGCP